MTAPAEQPRNWRADDPTLTDMRNAPHEPAGIARTIAAYRTTLEGSGALILRAVADLYRIPAAWVQSAEQRAKDAARVVALTGSGAIHHTQPADWHNYPQENTPA